jgi:hypothetical protein
MLLMTASSSCWTELYMAPSASGVVQLIKWQFAIPTDPVDVAMESTSPFPDYCVHSK